MTIKTIEDVWLEAFFIPHSTMLSLDFADEARLVETGKAYYTIAGAEDSNAPASGGGSVSGTYTQRYTPPYQVTGGGRDDMRALITAIDNAHRDGGGIVEILGLLKLTNTLEIPEGVVIRGQGRKRSVLQKGFEKGPVAILQSSTNLEHLSIDGNDSGADRGEHGGGILIPTGCFGQQIIGCEIFGFNRECLTFEPNGGSAFSAISSIFQTNAKPGLIASIRVAGTDRGACPRQFANVTSRGCTLFDWGGANDQFVFGGYSNGIIFGADSSKVALIGMRVGAAGGNIIVRGGAHKILGSTFATPVILDSGTKSIRFDSEVPDWNITDDGIGNLVDTGERRLTLQLRADPIINPSVDFALSAEASIWRAGQRIEVSSDFSVSADVLLGCSALRISLPHAVSGSDTKMIGRAMFFDTDGDLLCESLVLGKAFLARVLIESRNLQHGIEKRYSNRTILTKVNITLALTYGRK